MSRNHRKALGLGALVGVAVLTVLLQGSRAAATPNQGYTVAGCWYSNVYFGNPGNPETPKLPMIVTFFQDGSMIWTSTGSWGAHPMMPGNKGGAQGMWNRNGLGVEGAGIWFDESGGGAGLSVGRAVSQMQFNGPDELSGLADFDYVVCPDGPLGCIDPTEGPFLQLGEGLGPFPIVFHRLR